MHLIRLPSPHDDSYPKYPPARGPVLLLSCMDLRLLDETVQFMDHDGLTNRYDHVILAGAALGALGVPGAKRKPDDVCPTCDDYFHWRATFFDHLDAALALHHIKDVYVIEHRDCGAYREYLGLDFDDDHRDDETDCHREYAKRLHDEIAGWLRKKNEGRKPGEKELKLNVRSFLMGLRGDVELLYPPPESASAPPPPAPPKRKAGGKKTGK